MIGIIIPNYNGVQHLQECLPSLFKQSYKKFIITVVDNGSSDSSIEYIRRLSDKIKIIELKENVGFAKAINIGIKDALKSNEIEFVLLLNNDIECDKDFLNEMMKGFKNAEIGSVACKMLNFYNRKIIDDTGISMKLIGLPHPRGQNEIDNGQYDKEEYVLGACGGSSIYRMDVFKKVGYFDEDFTSYLEDVDYSLRLQEEGYKCLYNPKAITYHKRGGTANLNSSYRSYLCEKNLVAVRIMHYPLFILFFYSPIFVIARIRRYLLSIFQYSFSETIYSIKGYLRGVFQTLRYFRKRHQIQRKRKVTIKYILSLFE